MTGEAAFPAEGLSMRGRVSYSGTLWIVGLLTVVVLISDAVVGLQWLRGERAPEPVFVFAGVVLVLSTLLVGFALLFTLGGVHRQRYAMSAAGLDLAWRTHRADLRLPWSQITAITRRYEKAPGGRTTGVAVFVVDPQPLLDARRVWFGAPARAAERNDEEHGTPIFLDLTDVAGGTMQFYAAARWYAAAAGRRDLILL